MILCNRSSEPWQADGAQENDACGKNVTKKLKLLTAYQAASARVAIKRALIDASVLDTPSPLL